MQPDNSHFGAKIPKMIENGECLATTPQLHLFSELRLGICLIPLPQGISDAGM